MKAHLMKVTGYIARLTKQPKLSFRMTSPVFLFSVAGLMLYALHVCVAGPKMVNHSFDFGLFEENRNIEVLDWRYGDSKSPFTGPPAYQLANGHIEQATSIAGAFPVGDSLYVKWRVKPTGTVYADTVDLKSRLPSDITGKII